MGAEVGYHRGNCLYYEDKKFYTIISGDPNVPGNVITDDRVEAETEESLIKKIDAYYKRKYKTRPVLLRDFEKGIVEATLISFGASGKNPVIKHGKEPAQREGRFTKIYEYDEVLCKEIQKQKKRIDALESVYDKMFRKLKIIKPPSED